MIYIELLASVFTILPIYLITHKRPVLGARTGVIGQIFWLIFIFGDTNIHYGLIPADGIIFFLYLKKVWKDLFREGD